MIADVACIYYMKIIINHLKFNLTLQTDSDHYSNVKY